MFSHVWLAGLPFLQHIGLWDIHSCILIGGSQSTSRPTEWPGLLISTKPWQARPSHYVVWLSINKFCIYCNYMHVTNKSNITHCCSFIQKSNELIEPVFIVSNRLQRKILCIIHALCWLLPPLLLISSYVWHPNSMNAAVCF